MTKAFTKAEQIEQLAKAIAWYLEHEPLAAYVLCNPLNDAARRFHVSPKLLSRALRLMSQEGLK